MKPAMIAFALCLAPMTGLCQNAPQSATMPPPFVQQPDTATYQGVAPTLPESAVQPGQDVGSVSNAAVLPGAPQAIILPTTPGTAQEQGYDADLAQVQERLLREASDRAAMNTPRQLGQVLLVPKVYNPVSEDLASQSWLSDWATVLAGLGIPVSKVSFEASRLTREDFALWASRMVWAYGTPAQVRQLECCAQ